MSTDFNVSVADPSGSDTGHSIKSNIHSVNRETTAKSEAERLLSNIDPNRSLNKEKKMVEKVERYFEFRQVKEKIFYQALLSEYIGTLILVLISTSVGLPIASKPIPDLNGALVSGFIVATLVVGFGHISGAQINPAVTITLLVSGDMDFLRGLCFIGVQLLGAISASHVLESIAPPSARGNLGMTLITQGVTLSQAFVVEMIITFILCYTVHSISDKRRRDVDGSKALAVGLVVALNCLFAGPYTGASMNPARSFGPASVMNFWKDHWIYWVGPISGSLLAAILYRVVFRNFPLNN